MSQGDPRAADELLTLVYEELRKLAAQKMAHEAPGQTLQATALVHEAWLRLGGDQQPNWQNRGHFFAAAAEAMRRILVDNARRKRAVRHGGALERVPWDDLELPAASENHDQLLAINEALDRRTYHRGSGAGSRHFGTHSQTLVGLRASVALPRNSVCVAALGRKS
jgi:RNA polymerase sigma factor (TIGR02999 family)